MRRHEPPEPTTTDVPPRVLDVAVVEVWDDGGRLSGNAARCRRLGAGRAWLAARGVSGPPAARLLPGRGMWSVAALDESGQGDLANARLATHGLTREDVPVLAAEVAHLRR